MCPKRGSSAATPSHRIKLIDQIHAAQQSLEATNLPSVGAFPEFTPTTAVRREKLSKLPGITIHRGVVMRVQRVALGKDPVEADPGSGVPLFTGSVLNEYRKNGVLEPEHFAKPEHLSDTATTQPGDIVVGAIGCTPACKIDVEGWAVALPAFLIRVDPTAAIDADYLVTCINADVRTQLPTMGDVPRVQLQASKIDIPVIPLDEQRRISDVIDDLATTANAVERHLARLRNLSRLVETAVGAGALTTS